MKNICVLYLAWRPLGVEILERFLSSYRKHAAGVDHDLIVAAKGYRDFPVAELPNNGNGYCIKDTGFDIDIYAEFARQLGGKYKYFCFLNSYSQILCGGWLEKLHNASQLPQVGLVGCTGSLEVNPHIRTNAFMIEGEAFVKHCDPVPTTKLECCDFEHGKNNLTSKVSATGKRAHVVAADGTAYDLGVAHTSKTFRQGEQEGLMVADNRTDHYQYADIATRKYLRDLAWGTA